MAQKDSFDAKEYVKELKETYWQGYSAGYDAAIKNLRHSIGTACVSASTLKQMTMEQNKKKDGFEE